MITVKELKEWVALLPDDDVIGIEEGGLSLLAPGSGAYIEVGGLPEGRAEP